MSRSKHRPSKQQIEQLALWRESRKQALKLVHGGSLLRGNAKTARPLSMRRPVHLVMRSSLAQGERSFLRRDNARRVRAIIDRQAQQFGVRIYEFALVANHFHMLAKITSRKSFLAFLRAVSGLIARAILGAERGAAKNLKFWDARPFTRIVEWGKAFKSARNYLLKNSLESIGFLSYRARKQRSRFDILSISIEPVQIEV